MKIRSKLKIKELKRGLAVTTNRRVPGVLFHMDVGQHPWSPARGQVLDRLLQPDEDEECYE